MSRFRLSSSCCCNSSLRVSASLISFPHSHASQTTDGETRKAVLMSFCSVFPKGAQKAVRTLERMTQLRMLFFEVVSHHCPCHFQCCESFDKLGCMSMQRAPVCLGIRNRLPQVMRLKAWGILDGALLVFPPQNFQRELVE